MQQKTTWWLSQPMPGVFLFWSSVNDMIVERTAADGWTWELAKEFAQYLADR